MFSNKKISLSLNLNIVRHKMQHINIKNIKSDKFSTKMKENHLKEIQTLKGASILF